MIDAEQPVHDRTHAWFCVSCLLINMEVWMTLPTHFKGIVELIQVVRGPPNQSQYLIKWRCKPGLEWTYITEVQAMDADKVEAHKQGNSS